MQLDNTQLKFDAAQIETIIDRVAPLIATPELQGEARGLLHIVASECNSSAEFSTYIANLLKRNAERS